MSPVEILPPVYLESRLNAEAAKRRAREEKIAAAAAAAMAKPSANDSASSKTNTTGNMSKPFTASSQPNEKFRPHNLTQAMLQRPPLSRPASSGFLGNVYQGFVRAANSAPASHHGSTVTTPTLERAEPAMKMTPEMEKVISEKKRDANICAMPAWYH